MTPRLHKIASSFSEVQVTELEERVGNLEEHSQDLANCCAALRCQLERTEKRVKFLSLWMCALNDSNSQRREAFKVLGQAYSEQQKTVDHLTEQLRILSLK